MPLISKTHKHNFFVLVMPPAVLVSAWLNLAGASSLFAAESRFLWQIGAADAGNTEFALAPNGYAKFKDEGFFIVGESDVKRDWPYVQPGPEDVWAGKREHVFTVLFGLKAVPAAGGCRLELSLLDTSGQLPPVLRVRVNGQAFEKVLPGGAGDVSLSGHPEKGKASKFEVQFPASLLKAGDNEITLTTVSGSWLLYDWLALEAPLGAELAAVQPRTVIDHFEPVRGLQQREGKLCQSVQVTLRHYGGEAEATVRVEGGDRVPVHLGQGVQTAEVFVPAVREECRREVVVEAGTRVLASGTATLKPVPTLTVYILPHSHTDIGYTEIQTAIEKKQVNNLVQGIACARNTANYPEGARYVWNVEVLWAADLYLRRLNAQQRADFFEAVRKGQVALNGMYLNELTGLCRPEELVRLFRFATGLADQCGVRIDSAMISDVPGYTWGTVPAMAQAGIKYFSAAPNYFARIGTTLREWENKPFYWIGPDGQSKVLVWIPFWGYAMSLRYHQLTPNFVNDFADGLHQKRYPYDIAYLRWAGAGDNATPDPAICEFVKGWNAKYAWPRFIISSTSEAFRAFENRYGGQLPKVRGDWTPYWEDGAGSSAVETALNRASADRLTQAEALFALLNPVRYPAAAFDEAWRNVLLYSEHTWGANTSIRKPESQKTSEQWQIKQGYARKAEAQSRDLLRRALNSTDAASPDSDSFAMDVFNTLSWPRTGLVTLSPELSAIGDRVSDARGRPVPSQRLSSGELVFLASDVTALAAKRFSLSAGLPDVSGCANARGAIIQNDLVRVRLDENTGGIVELAAKGLPGNLADTSGGEAINDYLYLRGNDLQDLKRNGPVAIRVGEKGPLVASLIAESDAPGCKRLVREIRVIAGLDYVELSDTMDKQRLEAKSYETKETKESVNFAFPFNVPNGQILFDVPFGVVRPDLDQIPGACKNWLTVNRWVDVANQNFGVTWITLDAPLIEAGSLSATFLDYATNPDVWRKTIGPTQKFYSWVMNNHWNTNYRPYQQGQTRFRFILRPHLRSTPAEATRLATALSQPLVPVAARGRIPRSMPLVRVVPDDVILTTLKPSDDGKALIVRLFNSAAKAHQARLTWAEPRPKQVWLTDTGEKPLTQHDGPIRIPAWGMVTLRAELPTLQYTRRSRSETVSWQKEARARLLELLSINDLITGKKDIPFNPTEVRTWDMGEYVVKDLTLQSTPGRRMEVVLTLPKGTAGRCPAVVCIGGHGSQRFTTYTKGQAFGELPANAKDSSPVYKGFAAELARRGYVTIAASVSQHKVCEEGRTLMGERLWDLMRCVDYLESLPQVDKTRIGCAGLSLGGEMVMWLAAVDERLQAAVSCGFLTTMDHIAKHGCPCWNFPGLRLLVDFADIYALIAPRSLECQNGQKEPPTDFTPELASRAMAEIRPVYAAFGCAQKPILDIHGGGHEVDLPALLAFFDQNLKGSNAAKSASNSATPGSHR